MSEMKLNKVLFKDKEEDDMLLFDGEPLLSSKKA